MNISTFTIGKINGDGLYIYPYCGHLNDEPIIIRQIPDSDMKREDVKSICAAMPHHNAERGTYVGIFEEDSTCIGGLHVRISENNFRIVDGIYIPNFEQIYHHSHLLWIILDSMTNSNKIYLIDTSETTMFYPEILEELKGDTYGFVRTFENIRVYNRMVRDVGDCWIKINNSYSFDIFETTNNAKIASVSLNYENDVRKIVAKIGSPFYNLDSVRRQIDLDRMHVFYDLRGIYIPINCELEPLK